MHLRRIAQLEADAGKPAHEIKNESFVPPTEVIAAPEKEESDSDDSDIDDV